ncbi:MAG: tRNA1(Val) (adenine(37)-N6)-methyltransferase [Paracoccaceae bacterium]
MVAFAPDELSHDDFLGGRLHIWQPRAGYRAGVDAVLLAAAVDAAPGQRVLELGCGAGVASLCLAHRVHGLRLAGVELQPDYGALARRNAVENAMELDVVLADLAKLPAGLRALNFDHVIANPPYFERDRGTAAKNTGRDVALAGATPLAVWVDVATRRLKPGGWLTMIQKAARLPDLLGAMDARLGTVRVKPLAPRRDRAAELVIVAARKGGRGAFRLLAPMIMHTGARHERDADSYTPATSAILRDGRALKLS